MFEKFRLPVDETEPCSGDRPVLVRIDLEIEPSSVADFSGSLSMDHGGPFCQTLRQLADDLDLLIVNCSGVQKRTAADLNYYSIITIKAKFSKAKILLNKWIQENRIKTNYGYIVFVMITNPPPRPEHLTLWTERALQDWDHYRAESDFADLLERMVREAGIVLIILSTEIVSMVHLQVRKTRTHKLRAFLQRVLAAGPELDASCIDTLPRVWQRFTGRTVERSSSHRLLLKLLGIYDRFRKTLSEPGRAQRKWYEQKVISRADRALDLCTGQPVTIWEAESWQREKDKLGWLELGQRFAGSLHVPGAKRIEDGRASTETIRKLLAPRMPQSAVPACQAEARSACSPGADA